MSKYKKLKCSAMYFEDLEPGLYYWASVGTRPEIVDKKITWDTPKIFVPKKGFVIINWRGNTGDFEYYIDDHDVYTREQFKLELKKRSTKLWRTMYGS